VVSLICPRANKLKRERSFTFFKLQNSPNSKFQTAKSKPHDTFSHAHSQKKKTKKKKKKKMNHHHQSSGVQKQQRASEE